MEFQLEELKQLREKKLFIGDEMINIFLENKDTSPLEKADRFFTHSKIKLYVLNSTIKKLEKEFENSVEKLEFFLEIFNLVRIPSSFLKRKSYETKQDEIKDLADINKFREKKSIFFDNETLQDEDLPKYCSDNDMELCSIPNLEEFIKSSNFLDEMEIIIKEHI